jgi:hypothetical protein
MYIYGLIEGVDQSSNGLGEVYVYFPTSLMWCTYMYVHVYVYIFMYTHYIYL